MSGMASVRATLYNVFMRRTSTYAIACVVGSYAASHMYWKGTDSLWKAINRGVCLVCNSPFFLPFCVYRLLF